MAYDVANPPFGLPMGITGPHLWYYSDGDTNATVDTADYFTNGDRLGMKVGDPLIHYDTAGNMTLFYVSAVTAATGDGGADTDGPATVVVSTVTLA